MWVADELIAVAIAGDDDDVVATLFGHLRHRADDVVGLKPNEIDRGDIERCEHFTHQAHLLTQDVGSGFALRFVLRVGVVTKCWLGTIERNQHTLGLVVLDEVDKHRHKAEHSVGHLSAGRCHVGGQRKKSAVGQ